MLEDHNTSRPAEPTQKYDSVNGAWPEGSNDGRDLKPTPQEAVAAAKRLYRLVMGKPFTKPVKATSGNRRTGTRSGTLYVNPNLGVPHWPQGWHGLVHDLSHHCHDRLHPRHKPHDGRGTHAWIERQMIQHVVRSGWLEGKLKREPKPKLERPIQDIRRARVLASIKRWQGKLKRAQSALRKLERKRRYYEKVGQPTS
jgi:hypothetical protein